MTRSQRRFVEWLAQSRFDRVPASQKALAKELGVREETLSRWKPKLVDSVNAAAKELIKAETAAILWSIVDEAKKGSYQHAKLALELLGELDTSNIEGVLNIHIKYDDDNSYITATAHGPGKDNK